ncbi:SufD family Fe-S cluster assembly protein [Candidatus Woesearchaeota archaeon]|nr:SufD family Fe-S cluster assembly protein [Candidatus Woesearchaeota archaeon]
MSSGTLVIHQKVDGPAYAIPEELAAAGVTLINTDAGFTLTLPKSVAAQVVVQSTYGRNTIIVEEGSTLTLTYECSGTGTLSLTAKDNAQIILKHIMLKTSDLTEEITLGSYAYLTRAAAQLRGRLMATITLEGEHGTVDDKELFFGSGQQTSTLNTTIIHKASHTTSTILVKGVAKDNAQCFANGLVRIEKDTRNVSSHLAEHVLLLDKGAHAVAIPNMEIESQDVQARHAASVAHLDENQLFYAMTRGIPDKDARRMIVEGFLAPVNEVNLDLSLLWRDHDAS